MSSRRNAIRGLAALIFSPALPALSSCSRERRTETWLRPPFLSIRSGADATTSDAPEVNLAHAAWLTGCSLSTALRVRCVEAIESLVGALEARIDPLELGLGDDEPVGARLKAVLAEILPVYNASLTLTADRWSSRSKGIVVTPRARDTQCSPAERCIPAWSGGPEQGEAGDARFLAWPLTHALFVRTASAQDAQGVVGLVRERIGTSDTISLVLDRATQQRQCPEDLPRMQQASRRAVRLLTRAREKVDPLLEGLASADDAALVPWLGLEPQDVMIVPRQGALARRARFLQEAEGILGKVGVTNRLDPRAH